MSVNRQNKNCWAQFVGQQDPPGLILGETDDDMVVNVPDQPQKSQKFVDIGIYIDTPIPQNISESSQGVEPKNFESVFMESSKLFQDRNTLKFRLRLFLKYHLNHQSGGVDDNLDRVEQISTKYSLLCQNKQEKLGKTFIQQIFVNSEYSEQNRQIFRSILIDKDIIVKELYENGNVKKKIGILILSQNKYASIHKEGSHPKEPNKMMINEKLYHSNMYSFHILIILIFYFPT